MLGSHSDRTGPRLATRTRLTSFVGPLASRWGLSAPLALGQRVLTRWNATSRAVWALGRRRGGPPLPGLVLLFRILLSRCYYPPDTLSLRLQAFLWGDLHSGKDTFALALCILHADGLPSGTSLLLSISFPGSP